MCFVLQVFAGLFAVDQSELPNISSAMDKLSLNDRSVQVQKDSSVALGPGWRLGFLGLLHMEVFTQRLEEVIGTHFCIHDGMNGFAAHFPGVRYISIGNHT